MGISFISLLQVNQPSITVLFAHRDTVCLPCIGRQQFLSTQMISTGSRLVPYSYSIHKQYWKDPPKFIATQRIAVTLLLTVKQRSPVLLLSTAKRFDTRQLHRLQSLPGLIHEATQLLSVILHLVAALLHESSLFNMIQSRQSLLRIAILFDGFCMPCA